MFVLIDCDVDCEWFDVCVCVGCDLMFCGGVCECECDDECECGCGCGGEGDVVCGCGFCGVIVWVFCVYVGRCVLGVCVRVRCGELFGEEVALKDAKDVGECGDEIFV